MAHSLTQNKSLEINFPNEKILRVSDDVIKLGIDQDTCQLDNNTSSSYLCLTLILKSTVIRHDLALSHCKITVTVSSFPIIFTFLPSLPSSPFRSPLPPLTDLFTPLFMFHSPKWYLQPASIAIRFSKNRHTSRKGCISCLQDPLYMDRFIRG